MRLDRGWVVAFLIYLINIFRMIAVLYIIKN